MLINLKRLNREFFNRKTDIVAEDLIGKYLVRETEDSKMVGKIIEVEAYLGPNDKGQKQCIVNPVLFMFTSYMACISVSM